MFNYKIDFKDERITIIHGPNGFGKTTILELLRATFPLHISKLLKIPFSRFEIDFDQSRKLLIESIYDQKKQRKTAIKFELLQGDKHRKFSSPMRQSPM
jgi:predicted ATP-binding protein involved in virulence